MGRNGDVMFFFMDESSQKNKYMIRINHNDSFPIKYTRGSYNVFMARLFGLTWANFCRMCRDKYGAELVGKNSLYPCIYFEVGRGQELVQELNRRLNLVVKKGA